MLNNFGGAYTMKNIDDEPYVEMLYLQTCLDASRKAEENAHRKAGYVSKEFS